MVAQKQIQTLTSIPKHVRSEKRFIDEMGWMTYLGGLWMSGLELSTGLTCASSEGGSLSQIRNVERGIFSRDIF